ncbi:MAG: response regulator [Firmicutes bacterium]|nr:response regulator [Bacillota bacterium]
MFEETSLTILLVEDNPGHAKLVEKNLRRSSISNKIIILDNGQKALDFIFREGEYEGMQENGCYLILLDLNLPVLDGYEVLKRMKGDERSCHYPVIILTTTDNPYEVSRCYNLGCNVYITKPVDYDKFTEAIKSLGLFLKIVAIPKKEKYR